MRKTIVAVVALAVAAAFSPASFAAGLVGPSSKVETESMAQAVKAKKKVYFKKKTMKVGKKAKSKRGTCGAYMYRKGGKCMDARNKK